MIRGFLILSVLLLSACATIRPVKTGRVGLFERGEFTAKKTGPAAGASVVDQSADVDDLRENLVDLPGDWTWPLKNIQVSSPFGPRGRKFHEGVDLRAPTGTPIYAASDGKVIYSGSRIRGYGKMIVLQHTDGFYSIYAHNSSNLAKVGKEVSKGDLIAKAGRTGRAKGSHLHFEIRKGTVSLDPMPLMDGQRKLATDTKRKRTPSSL